MQISTKFTTAVHVLIAIEYFRDDEKITSDMLAGTVGSNPVIIRNIMSQLKEAGLIEVRRGPGGITLLKPLEAITFLDLYRAVETGSSAPLFHFHEHPNPACPVGRAIHGSLDATLDAIQASFEAELKRHTVAEIYEKAVETISKEGDASEPSPV